MENIEKLDQARREFLDECDLVTRVPATHFLTGTEYDFECSLLPIPIYSYVGITNSSRISVKIKRLGSKGYKTDPSVMSDDEKMAETYQHLISSLCSLDELKTWMEFDNKTTGELRNLKFKIWSEIPQGNIFKDNIECALGLLLSFFKYRNIEKINNSLEKFKEVLCRRESKGKWEKPFLGGDINFTSQGLNMEEQRGKEIFERVIKSVILLGKIFLVPTNCASAVCALIGREERGSLENPSLISYSIPLPKSAPLTENHTHEGKNLVQYFNRIILKLKKMPSEEIEKNYISYFKELLEKHMIKASIRKYIILPRGLALRQKYSEILISRWEGTTSELFKESIIEPFFFDYSKGFQLKTENSDFIRSEEDSPPIEVYHRDNLLRIIGPHNSLSSISQKIMESNKGWVYYISSPLDWKVEAAKLMKWNR